MLRIYFFLPVLLCGITMTRAQGNADSLIRRMQGYWIQSVLVNGEALLQECVMGKNSLEVDEHTFTWIYEDFCMGSKDKVTAAWKYHEADQVVEIVWGDYPSWYYEVLQASETTLHLRRVWLPAGSEDIYGLVYRRVSIPPQIGKQ